jgi:preprotein translocase subunit YajC
MSTPGPFQLTLFLAQGEGGGAPAPGPGSGLLGLLMPMIIIFFIFYILIFRPESKKRKERERMVSAVAKGDTVVTTGGIKGVVKRVDNGEVVVQIDKDKDVKVRFLKAAILEVIPGGDQAADQEASSDTQREIQERARH